MKINFAFILTFLAVLVSSLHATGPVSSDNSDESYVSSLESLEEGNVHGVEIIEECYDHIMTHAECSNIIKASRDKLKSPDLSKHERDFHEKTIAHLTDKSINTPLYDGVLDDSDSSEIDDQFDDDGYLCALAVPSCCYFLMLGGVVVLGAL